MMSKVLGKESGWGGKAIEDEENRFAVMEDLIWALTFC